VPLVVFGRVATLTFSACTRRKEVDRHRGGLLCYSKEKLENMRHGTIDSKLVVNEWEWLFGEDVVGAETRFVAVVCCREIDILQE